MQKAIKSDLIKFIAGLIFGICSVAFALSVAYNIKSAPEKTELFYFYGAVILTIIVVVGVMLFFFCLIRIIRSLYSD